MKKVVMILIMVVVFPYFAMANGEWEVTDSNGLIILSDMSAWNEATQFVLKHIKGKFGQDTYNTPEGKKFVDFMDGFIMNDKLILLPKGSIFQIVGSVSQTVEIREKNVSLKVSKISCDETKTGGYILLGMVPDKDFSKVIQSQRPPQSAAVYAVTGPKVYAYDYTVLKELEEHTRYKDTERHKNFFDLAIKKGKIIQLPAQTEVTVKRMLRNRNLGLIEIRKKFFWVNVSDLTMK